MLESIIKFILFITFPIWLSIILLFIIIFCFILYGISKGKRIPKSISTYRKPSFFKRIFWDFPKQYVDDLFSNNPDEFKEYGLHMFCGEQGSGKTTAVVHKLLELQSKYPRLKVRTNMNYLFQDGEIYHWQDLIKNENGIFGQVEVLDEIQTWFSSNNSKDFPVEMLTEVSQQRKQRKMLIGTAQVFSRMAKPIREQTTFVYLPRTILGCFTWVRVSRPEYWNDEDQIFKRYIKHYFFIHNAKIRNSFDTYQKIEKYKEVGFKEDSVRLATFGSN